MKKMVMTRKLALVCFIFLGLLACSKSPAPAPPTPVPPTPTPSEENIVFTVDIDPGAGIYTALGATQDAKVTISSKLPSAGVTVDVTVKKDADNSVVSSTSVTTTTSPLTVTISNLSPGVVCTATFTVTSKGTATNTASKSFKMARK